MKFIPYAQCKTPASKALYWKREAQYQAEVIDGLGKDPSFDRDVAIDAYADATMHRMVILMRERDLRLMERGA